MPRPCERDVTEPLKAWELFDGCESNRSYSVCELVPEDVFIHIGKVHKQVANISENIMNREASSNTKCALELLGVMWNARMTCVHTDCIEEDLLHPIRGNCTCCFYLEANHIAILLHQPSELFLYPAFQLSFTTVPHRETYSANSREPSLKWSRWLRSEIVSKVLMTDNVPKGGGRQKAIQRMSTLLRKRHTTCDICVC